MICSSWRWVFKHLNFTWYNFSNLVTLSKDDSKDTMLTREKMMPYIRVETLKNHTLSRGSAYLSCLQWVLPGSVPLVQEGGNASLIKGLPRDDIFIRLRKTKLFRGSFFCRTGFACQELNVANKSKELPRIVVWVPDREWSMCSRHYHPEIFWMTPHKRRAGKTVLVTLPVLNLF